MTLVNAKEIERVVAAALNGAIKYRDSVQHQDLGKDAHDLVVLADEVIRLRQWMCKHSTVPESNPNEIKIDFVKPDNSPPLSMVVVTRGEAKTVEIRDDEDSVMITYSVNHFGMLDAVSKAVQDIIKLENHGAC